MPTITGTENPDVINSFGGGETAGDDTINALGGDDLIETSGGFDTVNGGNGDDWLNGGYNETVGFNANMGDGSDFVFVTTFLNSSFDMGSGDDWAQFRPRLGAVDTITLGAGRDRILTSFQDGGTQVFTDFETGANGDVLEFATWFWRNGLWWDDFAALQASGITNPFGAGRAQLVDSANGALLQVRSTTTAAWTTIATFQGRTAAQFHADNFKGWSPTGEAASPTTINVIEMSAYPGYMSLFRAPHDTYGDDVIHGTDAGGYISYTHGSDVIYAGGGNDFVITGGVTSGYKIIYLGDGNDQGGVGGGMGFGTGVYGQPTGSTVWGKVFGGAGNDEIGGGWGDDELYGEDGDDRIGSGGGNDFVSGGNGNDRLSGGPGEQQLYGDAGNDELLGGTENDLVDGGADADEVKGEGGDDLLVGGSGIDLLIGGAGADTFQDTAANLNGDTIADFGASDRIVIADATLAGFSYTLSGNTLTYTGGSLTLTAPLTGSIVVSAAVGGGVQVTIGTVIPDAANDFNSDGRSDIMFRHDNGAITNFLGTANGGILNNGDNVYTVVDLAWDLAGTGDFNGDGRDDVLWRNDSGAVFNFLGTANGGVTNNGDNSFLQLSASWTVSGVGDFNGDGRDDILFRDANGIIFDYLGTASGGYTGNTNNLYTDIADAWHVSGIGDFNGDGRDDILFRNDNGAITNFLGTANGGILNNGDNIYTVVDNTWHIAATGDFNGDGRDDILWRNDNGAVFTFLGTANGGVINNGDNSYAAMTNVWHVEAIGDYNGDGRDDILWRHDNGTIIDWLGTASGGFTDNSGNLYTSIALQWQVAPADALI